MTKSPPKLKVFLCHATEDKPIVRELYERLITDGFDPWLDSELLVPGETWPLEIQKAMRASQAVIVCLSEVAIVKEGYIHTEIKTAQTLQLEKPEGTIFFIPLQLEECALPFSMREIQWGHYYEADGYEKLVRALNKRAEQVNAAQGVVKSKRPHPACGTPLPISGEGTGVRDTVRGGDNSIVIGKDANQPVIVPGSGNVININFGAATIPEQLQKSNIESLQAGLPPGSYLPFSRNALFTGREKDLEKLAKALTPLPPSPKGRGGSVVITQAITGMGGIGKTQLAVEFAYRYGDRFKGVHWLDLRDPASLGEQIAACGEKMALQPWSRELPEQVALTLRAWQMGGARLLILDNFESIGEASLVLSRFQSPSLRLLITSRHSDWPASLGLQPVPLDIFTKTESRNFLRKYLKGRCEPKELDELAERLGHLPLALELAGRYFEAHPRLSIPQYLTRLEQAFEHDSMRGFRSDLPNPTRHDLDLLATFALSWEQVTEEAARNLFRVAGYCAPNETIPLEIFEKTLELEETACDEAIQRLAGLGLLRENTSVHPLLAEFARHLDADRAILKKLTDALSEIANQRNDAVDKSGDYSLYTPLLAHIRTVAERAELAKEEQAWMLWNSRGYHINALADYHGAKTAYEHALQIAEKSFGLDDSNVAICVNNLGSVLQDLGDLAGAKAAYERALRMAETAFGPDHPKVAIRVNNLGGVLKDLGDLAGAKAAYESALKIWEANLGSDHPQVAIGVNNLGGVLKDLGDLAGAKAACERALRIDETAFGPDHPTVAKRIHNLSYLFEQMGDKKTAITHEKRTLEILLKFLPQEHPYIKIAKEHLHSLEDDN